MLPDTLSPAAVRVVMTVAEGVAPAPEMKISEWVALGKVNLTERTGSPKPGPFSFEGVEYIREPLDRLHPDDPAARVTVKGGAQSAKSSIGQLWVAWSVANNPKSFAIGLPSDGEVKKYNDYKLAPILEDSEDLRPRVRPVSSKGNEGSSARLKRLFNGATILIFNFGSPKELQMISTGNLILEEVANALKDVGGRGSPIKQARERQAAYSTIGSKELMVSTTGEQGQCEVTTAYELGDQRVYYGECPHCLGHFAFHPEGFVRSDGTWPHHFICPGCGALVEERHRTAWRRHGVWLPSFQSADTKGNPAPPAYVPKAELDRWRKRDVEGRQPSYYLWQAMCGLVSWDKVATSIAEAKTPADLKALDQQVYGRAWDPAIDALSWEELYRLREDYDHKLVPSGAGIVTAMCDVQGPYLQWSAVAWGPGAEWWVIDRGVILGDTAGPDVWLELDKVTRKRYPHVDGGELAIEAFGVDTGYHTQRVYTFCRGRPNCYALDGRPKWNVPIIGKSRPARIIENGRVVGRCKLWPTGTWEAKSLLAWSLKLSIEHGFMVRAQGRGHWSRTEDENWAQQITAEVLHEEQNDKTGETDRWWKKLRPNEETDIWVGARALAWMFGVGAHRRDGTNAETCDWQARAATRLARAQADMFEAPTVSGTVVAPPAGAKPASEEAPTESVAKQRRKWFG